MASNDSESLDLERLPEPDQQHDKQQEDKCEKEDDKEGKEEEMSLLGEEDGVSSPPLQIVMAARISSVHQPHHSHQVEGSPNPHNIHHPLLATQPVHQSHLATPDPDIQLAECESGKASVWGVARPGGQSVCGPRPAKLTTICLAVLSIWVMVVLIIHLDKKLSAMTNSLSYTEDKLKNMEDTAISYRHRTSIRLQSIQKRLGEILHSVGTGITSAGVETTKLQESATPDVGHTLVTLSTPVTTKHTTEEAKTEEEVEEDFFGAGWLDE